MAGVVGSSKTFDSMDPSMFCQKIRYYGSCEEAVGLMRHFLDGRKQKVIDQNRTSSPSSINLSLPQCTILGPILFFIYVSDFQSLIENCSQHNYADDRKLYFSFGPGVFEIGNIINDDLRAL